MCVRYLRFSKILKLILLSLLINLIFASVCFATVNMVPSTFNKSDIDVYEYLVTDTFGDIDLDEPSNWATTTDYNNYQSALNVLYGSSYTGFTDRGFSNRLYVVCSLTNITFSGSNSISLYGEIKSYAFYISTNTAGKFGFFGSTPIEYKNSRESFSGSSSATYVFAYTTNGWYELQEGSIRLDDIIVPPAFTPLYDHVIGVSGIQDNVYNFNEYLGGVPDTTSFGSFTDNFNDFIVDIHLNKYWNLTQGSLIARSTFYNSYYGSGTLTFNDNKEIYINDRYLEYDTIYCLMIYVYKDYQSFSNGDPLKFSYYYYYITTPTSAIVTGDVINYSGNSNYIPPNVDNNINNTNDNSQVTSIMGNFLSGDVSAKMGYDESRYDGTYYNFLYSFWLDMYDVLISSNDVVLTFDLHGNTYTFYSSQFITPPSPLKTFVSSLLIVGFFFLMYQQITQFIHELEEGNLMVMHDTDADIYFYDL